MHILLFISLLLISLTCSALELSVTDQNGNDIEVEVAQADGDLLTLWLVDHDEPRHLFDSLLRQVNQAGIEVWRVDLLQSYFLPRSSETVRTLDGVGVAAVLNAAHKRSNKRILLVSYDRMPLPLLRGVNHWQAGRPDSRLLGAILLYPNLFGPPPVAGEAPELDPILTATNLPMVIYQPAMGSQRWRLNRVMSSLWQAGSPAYVYLVPDVRDWFIMGEDDYTEEDKQAVNRLPAQISLLAKLLEHHPKPVSAMPLPKDSVPAGTIHTLVRNNERKQAPEIDLTDSQGRRLNTRSLHGKVILLNFWASWCPPCVEEIPSLNRLKAHYKDRDLHIVSVDYRETEQEMQTFLKDIPVDFPVLMDRDGLTSLAWQVFSFPSSFIIDRQGRIRYSANRAINWDNQEVVQVIDALLAEQ
ncbi:MAG: TlpA family protein disulfide reductase [Candidatus Thiodiazotropha sp. (ex Lucinoma borealis)]|nr:TlpA family protein disulfide reductase [Candidatus Thiodiazotropha sp. (ex Lucinoma borealis)]